MKWSRQQVYILRHYRHAELESQLLQKKIIIVLLVYVCVSTRLKCLQVEYSRPDLYALYGPSDAVLDACAVLKPEADALLARQV